jgi:putative oxidoreductase
MKKLFSINQNTATIDLVLLFLRVAIATLMLTHGIPKLASLASGNVQFPGLFGLSPEFSLTLAVFAEVICSILILVGLATRLAVVPLITTMLVAVFYIHAADAFAKQELAIMYLVSYLILFITGSGKYSVDYLLQQKSITDYTRNPIKDPALGM